MSVKPLKAVLVGAGKIGTTYDDDAKLAVNYRYVTHAQVLAERDDIEWVGVVDHSEAARESVKARYGVKYAAASVVDLPADCDADIAVLATPPAERHRDLQAFKKLKGVMVEKPLGRDPTEAKKFADYCGSHRIAAQVNYWRRSDEFFRSLADGGLESRIGALQFVTGVYCNGFMNNASHIVDFVRMLAGEVAAARSLGAGEDGEVSALALTTKTGVVVTLHAADSRAYRENGLELWGKKGRISISVEGLVNALAPRRASRATDGDFEITVDAVEELPSTVGDAMGRVWGNLLNHLHTGEELDSTLDNAISTEKVLAAVLESEQRGGATVQPI